MFAKQYILKKIKLKKQLTMKRKLLLLSLGLLTFIFKSQAQWSGPTSGILSTSNYVNIEGTMVTGLPGSPPPPPIFQIKSFSFIGSTPTFPLIVDHNKIELNINTFNISSGTLNFFKINTSEILFKNATQDLFKVDANGYLYARKAVVTLTNPYPDYVFEKNYSLMPLNKLANYINANKHLPNVPSLAEVEANNKQIDVGEMQLKLLEKVEELTLYILQQQKEIDALKAKLAE
jgi:hypothetical protein